MGREHSADDKPKTDVENILAREAMKESINFDCTIALPSRK
jgi:hypothetical protein